MNITKEHLILVIYDICNNKARYRMVKALEHYGLRVQRSAFECRLTQRQYETMYKRIQSIINPKTDSLRVYLLENPLHITSWGIGQRHTQGCIVI